MTYDLSTQTLHLIEQFESYADGTVEVKDYGRIWVVLVDSNLIVSVNVKEKQDDFYTFYADSGNLMQNGETAPSKARSLDKFVQDILKDISGD